MHILISFLISSVIWLFSRVLFSLHMLEFLIVFLLFSSVQFSSVSQSCPTLCDPMSCSTPGLPVHHQLLEFTQTHVHRVSDAIQPSHPLSSPSPPAPNPSQHQSQLTSNLIALWSEKMLGMISIFLNLPRLDLWPRM